MTQVTVEIEGLEELLHDFQHRFPKDYRSTIKNAMEKVVKDVEGWSRRSSPIDTGLLRSSIESEVRSVSGSVQGLVGSRVKYAPYMEFGTHHTRMPPGPRLQLWAERHGFSSGWQVAKIILRRGGLKARRFLQKAVEEHTGEIMGTFESAISRFVDRMGK